MPKTPSIPVGVTVRIRKLELEKDVIVQSTCGEVIIPAGTVFTFSEPVR